MTDCLWDYKFSTSDRSKWLASAASYSVVARMSSVCLRRKSMVVSFWNFLRRLISFSRWSMSFFCLNLLESFLGDRLYSYEWWVRSCIPASLYYRMHQGEQRSILSYWWIYLLVRWDFHYLLNYSVSVFYLYCWEWCSFSQLEAEDRLGVWYYGLVVYLILNNESVY